MDFAASLDYVDRSASRVGVVESRPSSAAVTATDEARRDVELQMAVASLRAEAAIVSHNPTPACRYAVLCYAAADGPVAPAPLVALSPGCRIDALAFRACLSGYAEIPRPGDALAHQRGLAAQQPAAADKRRRCLQEHGTARGLLEQLSLLGCSDALDGAASPPALEPPASAEQAAMQLMANNLRSYCRAQQQVSAKARETLTREMAKRLASDDDEIISREMAKQLGEAEAKVPAGVLEAEQALQAGVRSQ